MKSCDIPVPFSLHSRRVRGEEVDRWSLAERGICFCEGLRLGVCVSSGKWMRSHLHHMMVSHGRSPCPRHGARGGEVAAGAESKQPIGQQRVLHLHRRRGQRAALCGAVGLLLSTISSIAHAETASQVRKISRDRPRSLRTCAVYTPHLPARRLSTFLVLVASELSAQISPGEDSALSPSHCDCSHSRDHFPPPTGLIVLPLASDVPQRKHCGGDCA